MGFSAAPRRLRTTLLWLSVTVLTACGGGGGAAGGGTGGGLLPAAPKAASSSAPMQPMQIISQNGSSITLTGSISALISGGFQIQGGAGVGYLHIYTNASTAINGPAPYAGENVEVSGTGMLSSGSITAASVSQITTTPLPAATPSPGSSAPPLPPATSSPTAGPAGTPVPIPSGVVAQSGQIVLVSATRLVIQAGAGCGSMYVYLNSSTSYFNGAPQTGEYGSFTGTGTRCNAITASSVSLASSAFSSSTTQGVVASVQPYGFMLAAGSANIPVALTSSTVIFGATLAIGSHVTVTALGTAATGLTATQIAVSPPPTPTPNPSATPAATPPPISTTHVLVGGYVYGYAGVPASVPLSAIAPYVNWAQTDEAHAATLRSAGIKVAVYTNFWRNYTTDNPIVGYNDLKPGGANASAEAADCGGSPVYDANYGGGYEADPRAAAALRHAQTVVNYRLREYGTNYDAIFSDDTASVWGITLPCNYSEAAYDQAANAIDSALGVAIWVNALGAPPNPANGVDLVQPANVLGAMCEECYANNASGSDTIQTGTSWQNVENAEIGVVAQHKVFWDYARATGNPSQETALRTYAYASFLLGYDPSYSMFEEAFQTPSGLPVMPETGLVATNPLTTQSSVSGYVAAGGAYMREFAGCYYRGNFVARCAVVVNSGSGSVPVPTTSYAHALSLSGSGVLDGGTVSFASAAPSQLAPGTAAILFP